MRYLHEIIELDNVTSRLVREEGTDLVKVLRVLEKLV